MTDNHPITPPPELVQQWVSEFYPPGRTTEAENYVAVQAARWGADQELEACCEWFKEEGWNSCHPEALRAARRPKPPSLKERALQAWDAVEAGTDDQVAMAVIRRALEQLDD